MGDQRHQFLPDIDAFKGPDGTLGTAFNDGQDCLSLGQDGFDVAVHAHLLFVLVIVVGNTRRKLRRHCGR